MRYAVVSAGVVVNLIEADRAVEDNWIPLPVGNPAAIGDTYDGQMFYSESNEVRLTPEQERAESQIAELKEALELILSGVVE